MEPATPASTPTPLATTDPVARLQAQVAETHASSARIRALLELAELLLDSAELVRGIEAGVEAAALARTCGDLASEAAALFKKGQFLIRQADFLGTIESQTVALEIFRALGDTRGAARVTNLLGNVYGRIADYRMSMQMFETARADFVKVGDVRGESMVLSNLGLLHGEMGDHVAALEFKERGVALRERAGADSGLATLINNVAHTRVRIAATLRERGDLAGCERECLAAMALVDRAIALSREMSTPRTEFFCLGTRADALLVQGDLDGALSLLTELMPRLLALGDPVLQSYAQGSKGECLLRLGRSAAGVMALQAGIVGFERIGSRDQMPRLLRLESEAHEQLGDLVAALRCLREATTIERALRAEEIARQSRAIAAQRHIEEARLEAEEYRKLAHEDGLTGLANRRSIDAWLLALRESPAGECWVALADIDHFKSINDRFSHGVGDRVLARVGAMLRAHCRDEVDLAGRYGGEEFLLALRNVDRASAIAICERLRVGIETEDWSWVHPELQVTVSLGLAGSADHPDPVSLVAAADQCLYAAKDGGRNRLEVSQAPKN